MISSPTNWFKLFIFVLLSSVTMNSSNIKLPSSLQTLNLDGHFNINNLSHAARDFGNQYNFLPLSVLHPKSVSDIAKTIAHVFQMGPYSNITIAARGHGHSLQGQAQAPDGIVIQMESLKQETHMHDGEIPYVEASGGALWINVLKKCLQHGLAPKSWTDYLHLTVGGTLSNAGVSGQAFRHGPQISNAYQMEIVTGQGEVVNCSETENADLFFAVLGGLGQFGIITKARIALEPAPKMVKWIRILYSDFRRFTEDQEMLISKRKTFDYIEGFVLINRTGILNNWRSSFNPQDPVQANQFKSDGVLFCLEMTKNFNPNETLLLNKEIDELLSKLRYIPSTLFQSEVSYLEFLDRVHISEVQLRSKGLWEVPHPWLTLLIPRSKIHYFAKEVFGKVLTDSSNGPILMYPLHKSKWDNRTSMVLPDEDVFYLIGFLSSAPSLSGPNSLGRVLKQNKRILEFCEKAKIGMKQYLPHYNTQEEWRHHFGERWEVFQRRKRAYDPLAILAPGQRVFQKTVFSS